MEDPLDELEVEVDIRLVKDGKVILDGRLAELLKAVSRTGSLLAAAKLIGIPYSKAWRDINSVERKLGISIVVPRRGGKRGGGMTLTLYGEELLSMYEKAEEDMGKRRKPITGKFERPDLLVAGSHDLLLERALKMITEYNVEVHWIGSYGGLLSILMGDADLSGIHLLDPRTGEYNTHVMREIFPNGGAILIRGYYREVGWAFRKGYSFKVEDLFMGKAILANRNKGSGMRLLLDRLLSREAYGNGLPRESIKGIKGYKTEYSAHTEACLAVVEGKADVTLTVLPAAEMYGLEFESIGWERYDFIVREGVNSDIIEDVLEVIKRGTPPRGYRIPSNFGSPVNFVQ